MENPKDILLVKWLDKTISTEELTELQQDYDLDELDLVMNKQKNYDLNIKDSAGLWESLNDKLSEPNIDPQLKSKPSSPWIKLAVISGALFILGFGLIKWFDQKKEKVSAPQGQTVKQLIANNTQFILSPGSSLDYDESDWANNRDVHLNGHAFFDVEKGAQFTVHTASGTVRVLGTQFEVWEKNGSMKVSCIEGKVEVVNTTGSKKTISKNQFVSINQGIMSQINAHTLQKAEFLTARYNYQKISIVSLAEEIERYYNVKVTLDQLDNKTYFSGVLILDDLDKACSYLAETLNLKYERMSSGITFSKN